MKTIRHLVLATLLSLPAITPASAEVIDSDIVREGQVVTYTVRMVEGERRFYRLWADEDAFDVDIIVKDPFGDVVTADQDNDAVPQVGFRAWISGAYTIQVIMADTYNGIGAQYWLNRE